MNVTYDIERFKDEIDILKLRVLRLEGELSLKEKDPSTCTGISKFLREILP
jgi:hypothetical protein